MRPEKGGNTLKKEKNRPQSGAKRILISGVLGFGAAAGAAWLAALILEDTPKFEKLLTAVSLGISLIAGLVAGLAAGLPSKRPLRALAAGAVTLGLLACRGLIGGSLRFDALNALRAALTLAPAPLILLGALAVPARPKRRRRRKHPED